MQLNDALMESYGHWERKRRPDVDRRLFGLLGLWLVNGTDDVHFAGALRADKTICFVHLLDDVRSAPL